MTLLTALLLAPLILLTMCFAIELFVGLAPLRRTTPLGPGPNATAVVIVPAHDEAPIIAAGLEKLKAAADQSARILVVADNCTDRTAEIARSLGVEVVERTDAARRGKGFALDFARAHLRQAPPDVVIIVDADCTTDADSVASLIARCIETGRPCQAVNLQFPDRHGSPTVQLSTFAFFIKNVIRQRALQRLAGRVHLLGTGMAVPWQIFDRAALATDNIVEDLQMGVELAQEGHSPLFVEDASVWSHPETEKNTLAQRHRWEGGFLASAGRTVPAMLMRSLAAGDPKQLWAAINLSIPPLALLVAIDLGGLILGSAAAFLTSADAWPVFALAGSLFAATIGLTLAWALGGRRFVTLGGLARVPFYLLWKLPMYAGFVRKGAPTDWIRTR